MKKLTLIILTSIFVFGCNKINPTENLLTKVDSLKTKNDSLTKILTEKKSDSNYWFDAEYDGDKLIEIGIKNPEEFVENTLREKTELIPLKATLGGTMNFDKIQLLSREWLIADFSDGHIQGSALYKYKLNKKGQLEFELLNSIEPE